MLTSFQIRLIGGEAYNPTVFSYAVIYLPKEVKHFSLSPVRFKNYSTMKKIVLIVFPAALLLASCGGNTEQATDNPSQPAAEETAAPSESSTPGEAKLTVKVTGNSMMDMAYEPMSAKVKAGDKVTLTLINENSAEGMLHNWVLVKLGSGQEVATQALTAGEAKAYVPENENVIAASPLAKPNETVSLEFTAPAAGTYNYICTYPGHFPKMIGKLVVE